MTGQADDMNQPGIGLHEVERHFGDIAPVYSDARPNAALAKARAAADRMWQKVEEDLERIARADVSETRDA